jgi:hypothetical protein
MKQCNFFHANQLKAKVNENEWRMNTAVENAANPAAQMSQ